MSQEDFDLGFSRKEIIARTHAVEADKMHELCDVQEKKVKRGCNAENR